MMIDTEMIAETEIKEDQEADKKHFKSRSAERKDDNRREIKIKYSIAVNEELCTT